MMLLDSDIFAFAAETVRAAGQRVLVDFGRVGSTPKGDFDLITSTDVSVENFIKTELQRRFPTHQIIAEESHNLDKVALDAFCWVIDPLDGTVNFALGVPFFSISLALLYEGRPVLGLVYDPIQQELFHAQQGGGSFVNDRRLLIEPEHSTVLPLGGSSGFLDWCLKAGSASPLLPLMRQFGKVRILGSQALHLCYVAAGRLQAAISWEARLWDDAAGALIVTEAGACYTNFWSQAVFPLAAGSPLLSGASIHSVAAGPAIQGDILTLLAQAHFSTDSGKDEETK